MLAHQMKITVPSNIQGKVNKPLHDTIVSQIALDLTKNYGGCTTTASTGYYHSQSQGLILETVTVIACAYHDYQYDDMQASIKAYVALIKEQMKQESIIVQHENIATSFYV